MSYTVSETITEGFVEELKVAAVYVECNGKFLFLRRATPPHFAGEWCVPGGKVEPGEEILFGAMRELEEETGIKVALHTIKYLKPLYMKTKYGSFGFYIHYISLNEMPEVILSNEHDQYVWVDDEAVLELDIMLAGVEPFLQVQRYLKSKRRPKATISSYLMLRDGNMICLGLRQNTGYKDGYLGLVSGHVEEGESASFAMIREAEEEVGITIEPQDLKCVHIMHRKSDDRLNIDIFFECHRYSGTVTNLEPLKCGGWDFFDLNHLPENIVNYIQFAVEKTKDGVFYSEVGFTVDRLK